MKPKYRQLEDIVKGNSFDAHKFTLKYKDKTRVDITGATIFCKFNYKSKKGTNVLDLSIGSGITVLDSINGEFQLDDVDTINWSVGTYYWDIKIVFPEPKTKTYIEGKIDIIQNVT